MKVKQLILVVLLLFTTGMIPMQSAYAQWTGPYQYAYDQYGRLHGYFCAQYGCQWYLLTSPKLNNNTRRRSNQNTTRRSNQNPCSIYNGTSTSATIAYNMGCRLPEVVTMSQSTLNDMNNAIRELQKSLGGNK